MVRTRGKSQQQASTKNNYRFSKSVEPGKSNRKNSLNPKTKAGLQGVHKRSKRRNATQNKQHQQTNSVIFVSEMPCCNLKTEREKFKKLRLDSALFMSHLQPAKRVQSHISVITVSSTDEDTAMDRTAEWVAKVDTTCTERQPCEEGAITSDTEQFICSVLPTPMFEAGDAQEQIDMLQNPQQISIVPTPPPINSNSQTRTNSTLITGFTPFPMHSLIDKGDSLEPLESNTNLQMSISHESSSKDVIGRSQKFFFGPRENLVDYPTEQSLFLPLVANENLSEPQRNQINCSTSSTVLYLPGHSVDIQMENLTLTQAP